VHQRSSEALMAHIVNGDAPSEGISPAALGAIGRSLDIKNVRHELMGHANDAIRPSPVLHQTVLRLLSGDLRKPLIKPVTGETGFGMSEGHMDFIDAVVEAVEIVTVPDVGVRLEDSLYFQFRVSGQGRSRALAKINEDKAQVFLGGIAANFDFAREGNAFRRLFDALSCAVVFPAVIKTPDALALNPTCRELRPAMGAAKSHGIGLSGFAAIKRKILAHNFYGHRISGLEIPRHMDRMPEQAHIFSCGSPRTRMNKVYGIIVDLTVIAVSCAGNHRILPSKQR
jgi:hypothetical protein